MGDEEDNDLDLSWKMLDIARAIVEKSPENTMEKVKIYSALGEVALERGSHSCLALHSCILNFLLLNGLNTHGQLLISEDIDNSLSDYMKALSMLEQLVEPDHRRVVELYPFYHSYTMLCAKEKYYYIQP